MKLYNDRNGKCIVLLKLTGLEISMFVKKISIFNFLINKQYTKKGNGKDNEQG